jgi:phospholipase/carboxylesterase
VPTGNEPYTTYERGWIVRIQPPRGSPEGAPSGERSLLLLHGWTGDENVMWVFTHNLPANYWIFAPRAPLPAEEGGYGWLPREPGWPNLVDFRGIAEALLGAFRHWTGRVHAPRTPFDLMGFSQGAAMAYALAAYYPDHVNRLVALAGFLPPDNPMPGRYSALKGKKVYVAHGAQDETVPVEMAQSAVRTLQAVDAQVTYCESDAGHKLSASCLKGLVNFLT